MIHPLNFWPISIFFSLDLQNGSTLTHPPLIHPRYPLVDLFGHFLVFLICSFLGDTQLLLHKVGIIFVSKQKRGMETKEVSYGLLGTPYKGCQKSSSPSYTLGGKISFYQSTDTAVWKSQNMKEREWCKLCPFLRASESWNGLSSAWKISSFYYM